MSGIAGNGCKILVPFNERKPLSEIEHALTTKYKKPLLSKFARAIKEYGMIKDGDRVLVAISGGKDSMLMAKLFQKYQKFSKAKFEIEYVVLDPGYHPHVKELLIDNCKYLNIPIQIYDSGIFEVVDKIAKDYPCYMCAKMRRGALYSKAKELGCNKLALGHHFDDVIETTLLNVLYTGNFRTMLPKLKAKNYQGIELIRPLYYIKEKDIIGFTKESGIWPLNCACMVAAKKIGNKRYEIKDLIKEMKKKFSDVDKSIFSAAQNVDMDGIVGWRKDGKEHSYLDYYNDEE